MGVSQYILGAQRKDIGRFEMHFDYQNFGQTTTAGTCWHPLFERCVIIDGFPIARRIGLASNYLLVWSPKSSALIIYTDLMDTFA